MLALIPLPLLLLGCPTHPGADPSWTDSAIREVPLIEDLTARVDTEVRTLVHVSWHQNTPTHHAYVDFSVDGGETWMQTPARAHDEGPVAVTLLGIPADTDVLINVHVRFDQSFRVHPVDEDVRTGRLPAPLFEPSLNVAAQDGAFDAGYVLLSVDVGPFPFGGPFYVVIVNRQGRIVWYDRVSGDRTTVHPQVSVDGSHIIFEATSLYTIDPQTPEIVRTTLDKKDVTEIAIPELGFSYDELPDGSLIYDASPTIPEQMTLRHRDLDGTERVLWSCAAWMADFEPQPEEACMTNTVAFLPNRNTALWSMFATSTVLEISLDTGAVDSQWGRLPGSWDTVPASATFALQHYPNITADGTLLVATHVEDAPGIQRFREFDVDRSVSALSEVWTYGEGVDRYAQYLGEAQRLANGSTLIGYGAGGALQEVSPTGTVLWEIEWPDRLLGHATPLTDLYPLLSSP
ncbi:MAG: hypothetical protein AAFV53_31590 [Myxococcota bacterium]